MPRPPRQMSADGFYHVVSRGNKKAEIFHEATDFEVFMRHLLRCKRDYGISIFHYALMPNHIHLIFKPNDDTTGSRFMQKLKSGFALYYLAKYSTVGHVWQGRFKSHHIRNDAYLVAAGNYVEMNPVRAGLVPKPGDWPYSSFHHYAKGAIDPILETNPLFYDLGRSATERRKAYARLLMRTRYF